MLFCFPLFPSIWLTSSSLRSGLTGAGSSTQQQLVTAQLLRLSTSGKKDTRLAEQVQALSTILSSFGCAKTATNPSASRYSSLLELHFTDAGRLAGAKVLAYGLDKRRFAKLAKDERTFHAFYQLVAGSTRAEKDEYAIHDDIAEYRLFAKSGCYRLPPSAPNSDDSIAFDELRAAFKVLGFKPRHVVSIFRLLSAILTIGDLDFAEHAADQFEYQSEPCWVSSPEILERAANLLGVAPEDLERALTNRVRWVRKEMTASILRAEGADEQRDNLMASLYSILFAFIVETANHKLFPGDDAIAELQSQGGSSILQFSQPGFSNRAQGRPGSGLLVRALNGFDDFAANFGQELARFWSVDAQFDGDVSVAARAQEDGVRVAEVSPPDGTARLELLRGGRIGGKADRKPGGLLGGLAKTVASLRKGTKADEADASLLTGMREHFSSHSSFLSTPGGPGARSAFGINHFVGQVTYDAYHFVETDADQLDPDFVALVRNSADSFVAKLFSGPSLAAEVHPLDDNTIVAAQVSSMPLRRPSPVKLASSAPEEEKREDGEEYTAPFLDPLAIHPVSSQLNATLSHLLTSIVDRTRTWNVISLRPNDNNHPGQADARRLREQVAAFLLPELAARRKDVDFLYDADYSTFLTRHGINAAGQNEQQVSASFLREFGFSDEGDRDFALGSTRVWLSYRAFKTLEDRLRANEPAEHRDEARQAAGAGLSAKEKEALGGSEGAGMLGYQPEFGASRGSFNVGYQGGALGGGAGGGTGESVDDLLYGQGGGPTTPVTPGYIPYATGGAGLGSHNAFDTVRSGLHGFGGQHGQHDSYGGNGFQPPNAPYMQHGGGGYGSGSYAGSPGAGGNAGASEIWGGDKASPSGFATPPPGAARGAGGKEGVLDREGKPQEGEGKAVEVVPTSRGRRMWVALVWTLTWWIPSICLTHLGRMKRPDVRMAWREKVRSLFFPLFLSRSVLTLASLSA